MPTLKEIRQAFPEYAKVPDDVLSDALYKKYGGGQEKEDFFLELQGRGPRVSPIRAGIEGLKGAAETAIARGAQALGAEETAQEYLRSAQERGEDVAARYQPVTRSFEDVEDPYTLYRYLLERGGESAPQMAAMLGGGVLGLGARGVLGIAGLAAARGLPASAAAAAGSTAVGTGAYTGYNIQRQMEEGTPFEETSLGAAGAAALGQSALDTLSLATIIRGFPGLSMGQAGSRVAAAARRAVEGGATEALTETGQQALEILQANPEKLMSFSPEVQEELKQAAIAGGLLGGALGGAGGAISYRKPRTETPVKPGMEAEAPVAEGEGAAATGEGEAVVEGAAPPPGGEAAVEGAAPPPAETAAAPISETPVAETPVAETPVTEPPAMAPAPRVAPEPIAAEPAPAATVEPVTVEPAPSTTAQGPAPLPGEVVEPFRPENVPPLPKKLAAGSPKYDKFRLQFPSGIERALFQISKANPTKQDLEYRDWLKGQGLTDEQSTDYGKQLRAQLKQQFQGMKKEPATTPMVVQPFTPAVRPVQTAPAAIAETPAPVAAEPAAPPVEQAPPTTVQAQPAPPPPQTAPFAREPSEFIIDKPFEDELEGYIPGVNGVMREIQQNLFPGTRLQVVRTGPRARFRGQMEVVLGGAGTNNMTMRLNIDALKSEFKDPEKFKAKLLHTMFHEMAHPVEYFYLANLDSDMLNALMKQYVQDRNPDSMQRSFIVKGLIETRKGGDLGPVLDKLLKSANLTKQQYEKFLASQAKTVGDPAVRQQEFAAKYQRGFSEWAAEKGAKFFTKNLDQLVPKTVFEKFQKDILELLRDLYSRIAKFLGMPDTDGAFEQVLKNTYGKVKKTPQASIIAIQRMQQRPEYIKSKGRGLETTQQGVTATSQEAAVAEAPADVASATQKLAKAYTKPESMGFKGFLKAVKEAYDSGSYKNLGDKITYALTDRFIYVKRLQERYVDWLKQQGLKLEAAYDDRHALAANLSPYAAILGRENVLGMLETLIKYGGVPVIKKFSKSNDPLEQSLDGMLLVDNKDNKVGLTFLADLIRAEKLDAFKYYAMAKRVLGRYSDKKAPITQAEAQEIVRHYEKDATVTKAYKQYQDFNKALMKMAVDAGVISQDVANEFTKHNDYYPFYREMDETGKYTGPLFTSGVLTRTKIQQAMGGTEQLQADPVEVIMKNAQFWMHSASKNLASNKIFTMMEGLGEAQKIKKGAKLPPDQSEGVTRVNGVEQYYALKDPVMAAALETTGAYQLPNWTRIPGKFTQFYRELVTRSPDFILKNVIRDPLQAFVTSGVSFNPFNAIQRFVKGVTDPQSMAEMQAIQNWGIKGGFRTIPGVEDATQLLNENFTPTSNGVYVVPNGNVLTGIISKAWNKLGEISEASDAATRTEIYKQVLAKTGNEAEAAFRAQDVINFRKQGASSIVRYMSIMIPFVNGRLQGMDVTARAFGPKAFANTMIKGGYLFGVAMALQAMMGDDEEYKQLPEYVRYGSLPIPLKLLGLGDSGFVAIPKPFEIGFVFQTFPEILVQAAMGNVENRDIPKAAWEQLKSTFGVSPFPQIAAPLFEIAFNRSSLTGLPIVTEAQKNLPAELQYTSATSDVVKNLAGAAGLSPVQVEALIKGYGGQVVTSLLGLIDGMYRSATGTGVDKDWTQYPTISTFLKTAQNTNPRGVADIYRLSAEIQGVTTAINTYVAQGRADLAQELMKKNEGLLTMKQSVTGLRTQLNTLSRNERMIVNNPNIPQEAKEAQVEQIREARRQIGKVMTENLIGQTGK